MQLDKKNNLKKKILVICPHPEGVAPGQRLKYEQYFEFLESNDYQISVSPFMSMRFWKIVYKQGHFIEKIFWTIIGFFRRLGNLISIYKYDGVYIFLYASPFGPPIFEWLFSKLNSKLIYDIDDLVFLKPQSRANPLLRFIKSKNNSIYLMKSAKHVITCTPYLDQFVRKYNPNTTDISSTINTIKYTPRESYKFNDEKPILGWSGSFSTSKYLSLLSEVLIELSNEIDFKLLVMGDPTFEMKGIDVECVPWNEQHEVQTIRRFDIGLYPLPNEEWVLGKSGLKALQYMAVGVPTIATAIGTNFRIIDQNKNGFLVKNDNEWLSSIRKLLKDEELRKNIGRAGRQNVESKFSIKANKNTYLHIFNDVYG